MTTRAAQAQDRVHQDDRIEDAEQDQTLRTYVLDTSVLLSDPRAFFRFAEHNVVVALKISHPLKTFTPHVPELEQLVI